MSVIISSVEKGSPADKAGIKSGDTLLKLNGEEIVDVLDYRFHQNNNKVLVEILNSKGKVKKFKIEKDEYSVKWGVLTLIFCSRVAGILMIIIAKKRAKK